MGNRFLRMLRISGPLRSKFNALLAKLRRMDSNSDSSDSEAENEQVAELKAAVSSATCGISSDV